jgi:hypothetical protein
MKNRNYKFILISFVALSFSNAAPTLAITITLQGTSGGRTQDFIIRANVNAFGDVNADANGTPKSDRDPKAGKKNIDNNTINANVPDFTVGTAPNDATAGGYAKLMKNTLIGNDFALGDLRARADQSGTGQASTTSTVSTEPLGFFDSLDSDGLNNDALILFLIEPEGSTPIFNNIDPQSDSGSFFMKTDVQGDFFNGTVYDISASVEGTESPTANISVASGWQIFEIENFSVSNILSSANFSSSGLTTTQFINKWTNYITQTNSRGFGGTQPFGVWFVNRDIPDNELGEWTWNSNLSADVEARGVPEPTSTLSLLALGTLGATSTLKRKQKQKLIKKETTKVG